MSEALTRVLVVEDDPDDEALTLRALREWGPSLDANVVHSGREALAALGLSGDAAPLPPIPQVVLCDLCLRDMEGDELARRVREEPRLSGLPFVIFTSSFGSTDEARCLEAGASAFATKPIGYGEYKKTVADLAERWIASAAGS